MARSSASGRPTISVREEFARIGGRPLGLAFDRDENMIVCIAGMGVYGVQAGSAPSSKLPIETNRTWTRLKDDSRLYLADDLDIAPDGKIYFSEATTRYELADWALDGFEGRGNGRLICHDPNDRSDPDDPEESHVSERRLRFARWQSVLVGEHLAVQDLSLLDCHARRPGPASC